MLHSVEMCCGIRPMLCVLNCSASVGLNKCQYWVQEVGSQPAWGHFVQLGARGRQLGKKSATGLHRLSVGPWGAFRQEDISQYSLPEAGNGRARGDLLDHTS